MLFRLSIPASPLHGLLGQGAVLARINREGDRLIALLLLFHLLLALALAPVYNTWVLAIGVGAAAVGMFAVAVLLLPGTRLTRMVAGISLQTFVALHIYQMHGLAEMHFFFFTSVAALILYQDVVALWPGVVLIILQHALFAWLHNSGVELYFFEQPYVGILKLFFHFGIAIMHTFLCGMVAFLLREHTDRQAQQQAQMKAHEDLLTNVVRNYPDGTLALLDRDLRILMYDGQLVHDIGLSLDTYLGQPMEHLIRTVLPDPTPVMEALHRGLDGTAGEVEYEQASEIRRVQVTPILGKTGVERLLVSTVNLTQVRLAERALAASLKEKEVLLTEIHHRVKNNLSIVSGLLNLQSQRTDNTEAQQILADSQMRILAMAAVHESLYQSENLAQVEMSVYLERLTWSLHRAYVSDHQNIELQFNLSCERLPVDLAIPCGLMATEVLTNAFKHAFRDRQAGVVQVHLRREEASVCLIFADDGIGLPTDLHRGQDSSLGLRILHGLVRQLRAELQIDSPAGGGTRFRIRLPHPATAD